MGGLDDYRLLKQSMKELESLIHEIRKDGAQYAEAERDYRIAKAEKILKLREEGFPVTITQDVAMGCAEVSALRFDRDCAEVIYKSDVEAVNAKKLLIRILEADIDRQMKGA